MADPIHLHFGARISDLPNQSTYIFQSLQFISFKRFFGARLYHRQSDAF